MAELRSLASELFKKANGGELPGGSHHFAIEG
jgi:hypothetical protein